MARNAVDPVTKYALDVRDGRIVAGRMVRLACQRHLRDIDQQQARGLEWCPALAQDVIDFFAEVLCLPEDTDADDDVDDETDEKAPGDGTPFVLTPWQQFIVGSLFGWYAFRTNKAGQRKKNRRFRVAYVETGKGSGKTPLGAGILLYMLVADGEKGAQLFTAAVTKDQARLAFTDAERMRDASPHLRELVDSKRNNLAVLSTGSFLRPVSAEKRGLDGKRVHGATIDELHEHPTPIVAQKMRAGTKGRRNALLFMPTNAGYDRESVCWQYHEYSRQVVEGTVRNDSWFAYVCQLDACDACAAAGKHSPSDDCPNCDDWKTEGPHWLKVNPNLGVSLPWQYLREQVREAVGMPSHRNIVRRLNFCEWTDQVTVWIPVEQWAACHDAAVTPAAMKGRDCYLGIDLSDRIDLSSVELLFPSFVSEAAPIIVDLGSDRTDTEPADESAVRRRIHLNLRLDVISNFWLPRDILTRRVKEDNVPYDEWARDGHLRVTTGSVIDLDEIYDTIVREFSKQYRILGIAIDPAKASALETRLMAHFGDERVVEIPQGFRMLNEPCRVAEALVFSRRLRHDGNAVMNYCVSNVGKEENKRWNEIRPVKMNQRRRIDGWSALINGTKLAMMYHPKGKRMSAPKVWTEQGWKPAIEPPSEASSRA